METAINKVEKAMKSGHTIGIGEICGDKGHAPIIFDSDHRTLFWFDPFC